MLKESTLNISLVEALKQMSSYKKLMKDLVTKRRMVSYMLNENVHHCGAIASKFLVYKKESL